MKIYVSVFLSLALLVSSPAFAHNHWFRSSCPSCQQESGKPIAVEELPTNALGIDESALKSLYHSAHEAFETEEENASTLQKLADKFNFKQIALNAYRWYGMNKTRPEIANAAANITLMLLTSHGVETVGGLMGSGYAALHPEMNGFLRAIVGVGGLVIVIPGLDPVCIMLGSLYYKFPTAMNRMLEKPRLLLMHGVRLANAAVRIPDGYWSYEFLSMRRERMRAKFKKSNLEFEQTETGSRVFVNDGNGVEIAALELTHTTPGQVGLTALKLNPLATDEQRQELRDAISAFGWNVGNWAAQLLKAERTGGLEKVAELPFVQEVRTSPEGLLVKTKPEAFPMPNACVLM